MAKKKLDVLDSILTTLGAIGVFLAVIGIGLLLYKILTGT